jgi:16S rRNA processing protein RimM
MAVSSPEWVVLGTFGRPQGVKGLIRVISFTEPRENILDHATWFIQKHDVWCEIEREHDTVTVKHLLTQVKGHSSREQLAELTNTFIAVPQDTLPSLDEGTFYWHQLVGMHVIHETGETLGVVDSVFATGSNDVLVVKGDKRRLIPYLLGDVIQEVNSERREITVCWDLDF